MRTKNNQRMRGEITMSRQHGRVRWLATLFLCSLLLTGCASVSGKNTVNTDIGEDKYIYPSDDVILSRDEFFQKFDFGKMGISFQEATDVSNCKKVDLDDFQ